MDQKTLEALQALAAKLGTTAEYLWIVMVRQARLLIIADLAVIACLVFALVLIFRQMRQLRARFTEMTLRNQDPTIEYLAAFGLWILIVACGGIVIFMIPDLMTKIFNPEYWALQQILETVKGTK
jgi:hypothetical protein